MSTFKSVLVGYLCISSVLLHGLAILAVAYMVSAVSYGRQIADEVARAHAGQADQVGVIQDISVLEDDGHKYLGYSVEYKGQPLYVMGELSDEFAKGDRVAVIAIKPPIPTLKSLMVMLIKNGK